jgi:nucleotide-binding universal stress UspA family protein
MHSMTPYGHWLVAYDHSPHAERALEEALRALPSGAMLTLLHIVLTADSLATWGADFEGADQWELPQQMHKAATEDLERVAERVRETRSDLDIEAVVHEGEADIMILDVADSVNADVVVVGTHARKGLKYVAMGSVAERVARHAQRPVLLVRPHEGDTFPPKRILVPLSLTAKHTEVDDHLVDFAANLAEPCKAEVVFANVVEPELLVHWGPPAVMMSALERIREDAEARAAGQLDAFREKLESRNINAVTRVIVGTELIADSLLELCEQERCDLIVASSSVRTGLRRLGLGSVTRRLAHASPVPVVVIRPPQETV